jgi:chromosome segregation ATPase
MAGREPTITYDQVAAAASEIKASGRKPSLRNVREALGNIGSLTTISRYLQAWNDGQPKEHKVDINIPPAVLTGIQAAISQASVEAEATVRAELVDTQQALADITAEGERTAALLDGAETKITELEMARADLAGRLDEAKAKAAEGETRHAAEIELIKGDLARERQAAEAARTELAKAQLRLEAMPRLEKDLDDARREARENGARASEAERKLAGAEASLAAMTADQVRDRDELKTMKIENKALAAELGTARVQVQAQQVGLDASIRENAMLQERIKELKPAAKPANVSAPRKSPKQPHGEDKGG